MRGRAEPRECDRTARASRVSRWKQVSRSACKKGGAHPPGDHIIVRSPRSPLFLLRCPLAWKAALLFLFPFCHIFQSFFFRGEFLLSLFASADRVRIPGWSDKTLEISFVGGWLVLARGLLSLLTNFQSIIYLMLIVIKVFYFEADSKPSAQKYFALNSQYLEKFVTTNEFFLL